MEKRCASCGEVKRTDQFNVDRSRRDCLHKYCKDCHRAKRRARYWKDPAAETSARLAYRQAHPEKDRAAARRYIQRHWAERWKRYHADKQLQRLYGITVEDFESLVEGQQGRCALCGSEKKLCIDHSHITGKIRGLLCIRCNGALGQLVGDDTANLIRIGEYLLRGV